MSLQARLAGVAVAVLIAGSLAGCAGSGQSTEPVPSPQTGNSQPASTTPTPTTGSASPEASAPAATEIPIPGDSQYAVAVDGSGITQDYSGDRALVIDVSFTNNSDDPAAFLDVLIPKAFQNGIDLATAVLVEDEQPETDNATAEVDPGTTLPAVQLAYVLVDDSDITLQVTEVRSPDTLVFAQVLPGQ